jgi:hypothetical protein
MTMVETIARAMARRNYPGATGHHIDGMWDGWIDEARAALAALETPTPEMVDAGAEVCDPAYSGKIAHNVWSAMIRRAGEG